MKYNCSLTLAQVLIRISSVCHPEIAEETLLRAVTLASCAAEGAVTSAKVPVRVILSFQQVIKAHTQVPSIHLCRQTSQETKQNVVPFAEDCTSQLS